MRNELKIAKERKRQEQSLMELEPGLQYNDFFTFYANLLYQRIRSAPCESDLEQTDELLKRLTVWTRECPDADESSLAKIALETRDKLKDRSQKPSTTLEESVSSAFISMRPEDMIEDLARYLYGYSWYSSGSRDLVFRALFRTQPVLNEFLFREFGISEEQTLLREYVHIMTTESNFLGGPLVEFGPGYVLQKLNKHLKRGYTDEQSDLAKKLYDKAINDPKDGFIVRFVEKFKDHVECICLGGSLGRGWGFDPHSDADIIVFYDDNTDDQKLNEMLRFKQTFQDEFNKNHHASIDLCTGGKFGQLGYLMELWEITSPSRLKAATEHRGIYCDGMEILYKNVTGGKILWEKTSGWYQNNILPILESEAAKRIPERLEQLKRYLD